MGDRERDRAGYRFLLTLIYMNLSERIQAVSKFLLESPPGEINDVLNGILPFNVPYSPPKSSSYFPDVRNVIADDDSLQQGIAPALREYNLTQFITADVPGSNHQVRSRTPLPSVRALSNNSSQSSVASRLSANPLTRILANDSSTHGLTQHSNLTI